MSDHTTETAPDGSTVLRLARGAAGSMAQFSFAKGSISRAVRHRRVEELWYVLEGKGEIWLCPDAGTSVTTELQPGASVLIEAGCAFQVRVQGGAPLEVLAVTMPPWPGDEEAELVAGRWR